eukprot:1192760-Amphidinium_carterae.2
MSRCEAQTRGANLKEPPAANPGVRARLVTPSSQTVPHSRVGQRVCSYAATSSFQVTPVAARRNRNRGS